MRKLKAWYRLNKKKITAFLKKWLQFFLNPRLLICFLLGWLITNGWSYILFGLGTYFGIGWMIVVSSAYMSFLWFPFTPEKIITIILAIFFLRFFFPNDTKTLKVLKDELSNLKKKRKTKKKKSDKNKNVNLITEE